MSDAPQRSAEELTKSARAAEIDQLVIFIRNRDIQNARRMLKALTGKGKRISREIVDAYERLGLDERG